MKHIKVLEVAHHRNGIGGTGFYVVRFDEDRQRKVAVVFPERGSIAVLDVDLLAADVIAFGENSWHGNTYEDAVREATLAYEEQRSKNSILNAERLALRYGEHDCVPYTREGGLILAEEKYGTCAVCGERVGSIDAREQVR